MDINLVSLEQLLKFTKEYIVNMVNSVITVDTIYLKYAWPYKYLVYVKTTKYQKRYNLISQPKS